MEEFDSGLPAPDPNPDKAHVLVMSDELKARIVAHLHDALPDEGVGLLAVTRDRTGLEIVSVPRWYYPGTNIRQSPSHFQLDWQELVRALRDIDTNGWELGAIVHSHPLGPATPSATDLGEAWYPESLMVIVSFAVDPPDIRAWSLIGGQGAWTPREARIVPDTGARPDPGIAGPGGFRE